jgi:hypothetical protein
MDDITAADRVSPLWEKLMRRTRTRITQAHLDLEKQLTPEQTEKVRGRLVELRAFERLDRDEPQFPQPVA